MTYLIDHPELQVALRAAAPQTLADPSGSAGLPTWVIPLQFAQQPLGVIVLSVPDLLNPNGSRIIQLFSSAVAVALANARTHARSRRLAELDPLTECANRRSGLVRLDAELAAATAADTSAGEGLGVLMIDLDHFKAVNDLHGHLVGDRVLAAAARTISGCLRATDTVMRYGGEEFCAVLPGVRGAVLAAAAERICNTLRHSPIDVHQDTIAITASIGYVWHPHGTTGTTEQLLGQADEALYRAKASGRDRVVSAHRARAALTAQAGGTGAEQ